MGGLLTMALFFFRAAAMAAVFPEFSAAETPEEKGRAVNVAMDKRDEGWGDLTLDAAMIVTDKRGNEKVFKMYEMMLETPGDSMKGIITFVQPADLKGITLLLVEHRFEADDAWMWFPAQQRTKRISGEGKTSSFMGSEFTNEDFSLYKAEKFAHRYVGEEEYEGQKCHVIDRFPAYEHSGYKRQRLWIDRQEYRVLKIDFYDLGDVHLKTLYWKNYKQYLGRWWRPSELLMVNRTTGAGTRGLFENLQFCVGLKDADFSLDALKRYR